MTLIELAIAILVLFMGITAAVSLTLAGLKWGYDIRDNTLAIDTARSVMADASLIDPSATNRDPKVEGTVNGFYVVREVAPSTGDIAPDDPNVMGGYFEEVTVQVYSDVRGGNTADGKLLWEVTFDRYEPKEPMEPSKR